MRVDDAGGLIPVSDRKLAGCTEVTARGATIGLPLEEVLGGRASVHIPAGELIGREAAVLVDD